jgi:2,3-bisphosphoglycerate-independent phosphoglycerate mutase
MYKGVAKLIGMDALEAGDTLETEVHALKKHWTAYDFFYFHVKKTDSAGEDGDFDRKVHVIEHTDQTVVPAVRGLNPDVIIVTGDHSTPSIMRSHSWHPLPVIFWSRRARRDAVTTFGETACAQGALGHVHHTHLMPLAMGHAGRLNKYGA